MPQPWEQPEQVGQPPVSAHPGRQWQPGPGQPDTQFGSPPTGWNYLEGLHPSELMPPPRKIPPSRGWRRFIYNVTGGAVNLGQSPDELQQAHLEGRIRTPLRGQYKIGVLGKGGVGKTTVAACVGSIFAQLRQDDRVVAIDADTVFGKLGVPGWRSPQPATAQPRPSAYRYDASALRKRDADGVVLLAVATGNTGV